MAYKYGNREQITFLPESIESYVTDEDPVRVYDAFIDALDLKELGVDVDEDAVGNSSYDPSIMLKILVYGYSYGWRSSRKLERALHHNLSFIWLAGGLKPDHKTIANFRKDNKQALKNILKQCARLCLKLNLIEGNTLFVDGSKFRANAGKSQTKTIEGWETYRKHVEKQIERLLDESQQLDESEKESLVRVSKELKGKKALKSKIDQLLEEINESEPKPSQKDRTVNGTDPDCKIMKGRQGSHASYNNQMVVDDENGLIVSMEATTATNDLNQLKIQITQGEEVLEKTC
jgi:transposase